MQIDSVELIRKLPAMLQGRKKFAKIKDGGNYHVGEVDKWCLTYAEVVKAIEDYCEYKNTGKFILSAPINGNWNVLNAYSYNPIPEIHEMREATPEELESVNDYIKSISKPTGVNIWDKIEEVRANSDNYDYNTHSYRKGCSYSDRTERSGEDADSD